MRMRAVLALFLLSAVACRGQFDVSGRVDPNSIREYLHELTRRPHLAGSDRDRELAEWVGANFESSGLDRVQGDKYHVLLSRPNPDRPNKIRLVDGDGRVMFTSQHREEVMREEDNFDDDFVDSFLAFTPAGDVSGPPVYANYAQEEDFEALSAAGVSVEGALVVARYGYGHRGNKVKEAEERGAAGVVLFSDPEDVAMLGTEAEDVYPNSRFLPGSGMQRGTTKVMISGDVLSSGWASVDNAYRLPVEDREGVPRIPAQPIGYDDAREILSRLGGPEAPEGFIGGIQGIEYRLGGEFAEEFSGWRMELETHNYFEDVPDNEDVIGIIRGSEEPDRYVILCNHRDAWGFGGVDPSSGTALLLETARVLGEALGEGWRPRRSIVIASWAVEEYGTIGSTEWVFHKLPKLRERTVAVLNVDATIEGPIFTPRASPSLAHLPVEASMLFEDPAVPGSTLYETWREWLNQDNSLGEEEEEPTSSLVGAGSDHDPFIFTAGIPVLGFDFSNDDKAVPGLFSNPTYHTGYETFFLVDEIIDPGFVYNKLAVEIAISLVTTISEADILPFEFQPLAELMADALLDLEANGSAQLLEENGATLQHLVAAVLEFSDAISTFEASLSSVDTTDPLQRRMANDQIMQLERAFVGLEYLPGREDARHLIYSPSKFNRYGSTAFPGLGDLLYEVKRLEEGSEDAEEKWKEVRRHVSDLMIAVSQAASFLEPFECI